MNRIYFLLLVAALSTMTGCQPAQKKITVGYVQITQDAVLDAARDGVFRALADSGFIDGQNIRIIDNNAQGDLSMITTILQSLQSQNVGLIITNSTPCMVAAAQTVRSIPVVFTVSFGPEQIGLASVPDNLYGVYDVLKADEFIGLMKDCIPGLSRVGIPFNNAEPNAEYSVRVLGEEFTRQGITLVTAPVNSSNDILQAGQYLAGQQIDALVVAADNTVYLGLPLLVRLAGENDIPLFVSDPLQTDKGAAVGYGARYNQWGYQSGLKAVEILRGRIPVTNKIEPTETFDLSINLKACADQGLIIPPDVLNKATQIIK
jgi:putative tryptophan/tyrosine transport system substrate-binding protein